MSTFQDLLDFVTPLAPADQVKEMVTLLKKEDKQYLFKYGTVEEIIAFPHQQLQNRAKLQYHLFIKMIFEEASKRGRVWVLWDIWKKQPNFRVSIDFWFIQKIIRANDYKEFEQYVPFVSPQIVPLVYLTIFNVVTPHSACRAVDPQRVVIV